MGVAAEIGEDLFGRAKRRLGVDEPVPFAQGFKSRRESPCLGQSGQLAEDAQATRVERRLQVIEELGPYLIGWRGSFGVCQTPRVLTALEARIRRRLRPKTTAEDYECIFGGNGRATQTASRNCDARGVPKFNAAVAAGSPTGFWRMSRHPAVQMALPNHTFDDLGLPRLYVPAQA